MVNDLKKKLSKYLNVVYPLIGVGLFLLAWFIASKIVNAEIVLPTPGEAIERFIYLLSTDIFWLAVANTLGRTLISFVLSLTLAIIFSVASYVVPQVGKILNPIVVVLRSVPTMSIILLALIWMSPKTAPLLIAFLILFPQLYASFLSSLNGVDLELIEMSKAFKVPLKNRIFGLYIPSVLPSSLDAMRANVSLGVKVTIAGEVLAQTSKSMGIYMQISKMYFDTAELLGWTVMAIILSYLLEGAFSLIKYFVVRCKK